MGCLYYGSLWQKSPMKETIFFLASRSLYYGVASDSRLDEMIGLCCKSAL